MGYFKGILIIIFISLVLAFSYNYFSPCGIALIGSWDRSKGVVSANTKTSSINRDIEINSAADMARAVKDDSPLILDVRSNDLFLKGHIPGARSVPLSGFDRFIGTFFTNTPMDQKIIVYCSGRECTDSHTFASKLSEMGYANVKVYAGGFMEWKDKGYKVAKD